MDHFQYLGLMAACAALTLPLELFYRAGVWSRPARLLRVVAPPLVIFSLWDVVAIGHGLWRYDRRYITGWYLPGHLPVEEVVFFFVVPVCSILAFQAVRATLERDR